MPFSFLNFVSAPDQGCVWLWAWKIQKVFLVGILNKRQCFILLSFPQFDANQPHSKK